MINMDIIEELTYLSTPNGGSVSLDIVPGAGRGTSRPGTRGANRGEKEDFKVRNILIIKNDGRKNVNSMRIYISLQT